MDRETLLTLISANVKAARKELGLPMRVICERTGLTMPHLSRIESGQKLPTLETLIKIAAGLRISPKTLLHGIKWTRN